MGTHIDSYGGIIVVGKGIAYSCQFTLRFYGRHEFYAINCGTVLAIQILGIIVVHLQSDSISTIGISGAIVSILELSHEIDGVTTLPIKELSVAHLLVIPRLRGDDSSGSNLGLSILGIAWHHARGQACHTYRNKAIANVHMQFFNARFLQVQSFHKPCRLMMINIINCYYLAKIRL